MEKVGAELRIENSACEDRESNDRKYGDNRNKQIGDDEPVPETPEQSASPPTHKADENVNSCQYCQVRNEVENATARAQKFDKQAHDDEDRANDVQPRKVAPDLLQTCQQGFHRIAVGRNTLPEDAPARRV